MIYLAVLLILSGLLIVIAALFIEKADVFYTGNKPCNEYDQGRNQASDKPEDIEIIFPDVQTDKLKKYDDHGDEEDIFISFNDELNTVPDEKLLQVNDDWGIEKDESSLIINKNVVYKNQELIEDDDISFGRTVELNSVMAVMFDDRSNIIDYESGVGVIDSTLAKYKSIKRIGKGRLEADSDGLNFFLGEKLYRFDFHKVYDIWSGNNYVALPLKGSSNVKLFLIENPSGFPEKVELYFKEFEKGL
jgi:hypothetical protein